MVDSRSYRLSNIDMIRGLVIIIMALDHVRTYFMITGTQHPMEQPDIPLDLYFTRWISHFCAPVFVFLAGTSAGLMSARRTKHAMAKFLATRGLWLIFVEVVIISTGWSFSPFEGAAALGGARILVLQVIWAIGASMLVLAAAQYLGEKTCLAIGLIFLLGHNSLDSIWPAGTGLAGNDPLWYGLLSPSSTTVGPYLLLSVYPVLPWIGVMLLGYGTAFVFKMPASQRDRVLIKAGLTMIVAFIIIRISGLYGDPNLWAVNNSSLQATMLDFMNITKYPPSLLFVLITLGPMSIVCAYADRVNGWFKNTLVIFGRVPFAFYVTHIYLIHALSIAFGKYQGYSTQELMTNAIFYPAGFNVGLIWVYVIWLAVVTMLYPLCKWVANVKAQRKDWWLSYL